MYLRQCYHFVDRSFLSICQNQLGFQNMWRVRFLLDTISFWQSEVHTSWICNKSDLLSLINHFENIPNELSNIQARDIYQINACRYHITFCENEAHKIFHIKCSLDFVPEGFVQFPKLPKLGLQIPEFRIMYLKCLLYTKHTQDICQRNLGFMHWW